MNLSEQAPFSLRFTAASLRPEMIRVVADAFVTTGDWDRAKARILESNALQARSVGSAKRMELEFRQRLRLLTPNQIQLAAKGFLEERTAIAWLAAIKSSSYIHAFAADVLRNKLATLDPVLRASDYEAFVENQLAIHPEVAAVTPATRVKLRSVLLSMVREAGILVKTGRELRIHRPIVPPAVQAVILEDSPHWLSGFLVPDSEIPL